MDTIIDPEKQLEESIDTLIDRLQDSMFNPNTQVIQQAIDILKLVADSPRRLEICGPNQIATYFQEPFK